MSVLKAVFKDPYNGKKTIDELDIQVLGFSKEVIYEKLKRVVDDLPMYNVMKDGKDVGMHCLNSAKFSHWDGFFTVNRLD